MISSAFAYERLRLPDRTPCRTIPDIRVREFARPAAVVASARGELRGMVREGEQMPPKKLIDCKPCGVELCLSLCEPPLRAQHVGKTPSDLQITARKRRPEERLRIARSVLARIDLREVHTRLNIARQVSDCASIPELGNIRVRDGHEFSPPHTELEADPCQRKRRSVLVRVKRFSIDSVRLGETLEIC
jgi:hypothetical protein